MHETIKNLLKINENVKTKKQIKIYLNLLK